MTAHTHTEYVDGCFRCDLNRDEAEGTAYCEAEVQPAVFYLPNGDPGYPAEYCENEAVPGSTFCNQHQGEDFWDAADRMYDEARDRAAEREDDL